MDVTSLSSAASLAQSSQTQQALSASMLKMNADSQNQIAEMVKNNSQQSKVQAPDSSYGFSTYA